MSEKKEFTGKKVWESDKHVLIEKEQDNGGAILVLVFFGIFVMLFIFTFVFLLLPLILAILSLFFWERSKIWIASLSILSQIYLIFDLINGWISGHLLIGYTDSNGMLQQGFFSSLSWVYLNYEIVFYLLNFVGVLIAIYSIYSYYQEEKKQNDITNKRNNEYYERFKQSALNSFKNGNNIGVISNLNMYFEYVKNDSEMYLLRAKAKFNHRNKVNTENLTKSILNGIDEIIEDVNAAIKLNSKYQEAIEFKEVMLNLKPRIIKAEEHFKMGVYYFEKNDFESALKNLNLSLQTYNEYSEAYFYLGLCYFSMSSYEKSIEYFNKTLSLNGKHANALFYLGLTKFKMSSLLESLNYFNKAIDLKPKNTEYYFNRGATKSELKDFFGAIEDMSEIIKLKPKNSEAYVKRGTLYIIINERVKALKDFSIAAKLGNKNAYLELEKLS
jgi:Tfp pilus assembly protein PilF